MGMEKTHYKYLIYTVSDRQEPDRVRYVGQTSAGLSKRRSGHWGHVAEGRGLPISNWLRKRIDRRDDVVFETVATADSRDEVDELEILWIAKLKSIGQCDLNILPGGNSMDGFTHSERTREMWREQRRYGRVASSVLTPELIIDIRRMSCSGATDGEVAARFGVSGSAVGHIMRGESWGYIPWGSGTHKRENSRSRPNLSIDEVAILGELLRSGKSVKGISAEMNINPHRISKYLAKDDFRLKYELDSFEVKSRRVASASLEKSISNGGDNSRDSKIDSAIAAEVKRMLFMGHRQIHISEDLKVSRAIVQAIDSGKSWRHVPWPIGPRPRPYRFVM